MANLPDETIDTIFSLKRQLWQLINQTTAVGWAILEEYGETEETFPTLEQLDNLKERLTDPYSRLHAILLRVGESQPRATTSVLDLLEITIEQAQATVAAADASIQEVRRDLNLL
jgi:hypothetical protein